MSNGPTAPSEAGRMRGGVPAELGVGAIGGTIGGLFGARLLLRVSHAALRWMFVAVLLLSVLKLVLGIAGTERPHLA